MFMMEKSPNTTKKILYENVDYFQKMSNEYSKKLSEF